MNAQRIGLVGGGRVTRVLLGGLERARRWPESVVVSDLDPQVLETLRARLPRITALAGGNARAAEADLVFLAVHPAALGDVLGEIGAHLRPEAIVVSLAPKWTIARIGEMLGGFPRIARAIPNAPSIVNRGYNPLAFGPGLGASERRELRGLFEAWGECPEVPEADLEAYAVLTGMGPTYFWYQFYALVDLACSFGLDRGAAEAGLAAMVEGTLRTMTESGLTREDVVDLIPARPLAAIEEVVRSAYATALPALHRRLTG